MNSGLFFELSPNTDLANGLISFIYKPIRQKGQYPVYCVCRESELVFYYSDKNGYENNPILRLNYEDATTFEKELNQQLNQISDFPRHKLLLDENKATRAVVVDLSKKVYFYSCVKPKSATEPEFRCFEKKVLPGHEKRERGELRKICLATLFLDFLFDFRHAEVFQNSPAYVRIRAVLKQNHLLKAICAKAEWYYQQHFFSKHPNEPIEKLLAQHATNTWLDILMDDLSPEILSPSSWFEENLEKEAQLVWESAEDLISERTRTKLVEWYLGRFNYLDAVKVSMENRKPLWALLVMAFWAVIGFLLYKETYVWGLGLAVVYVSPWVFRKFYNLEKKWKETHKTIAKIIFLAMPRLLITLFLAWIVYAGAALGVPQISGKSIVVYLGVSIFLVYVYLAKEIKLRAPDMPVRKMTPRISFLITWAILASVGMGAIILTVAFDAFGYEAVSRAGIIGKECWGYNIALNAWASATIFVFFFGLFVNLLFAGKKFTGF